jgi:hypothetical protein
MWMVEIRREREWVASGKLNGNAVIGKSMASLEFVDYGDSGHH